MISDIKLESFPKQHKRQNLKLLDREHKSILNAFFLLKIQSQSNFQYSTASINQPRRGSHHASHAHVLLGCPNELNETLNNWKEYSPLIIFGLINIRVHIAIFPEKFIQCTLSLQLWFILYSKAFPIFQNETRGVMCKATLGHFPYIILPWSTPYHHVTNTPNISQFTSLKSKCQSYN